MGHEAPLRWVQLAGLAAGPLLAAATFLALPESYLDAAGQRVDFGAAGRVTGALAVWMATWWISEAIPIPATALLPLAVLPLTGASDVRSTAAPYGHELIFLFLGGFVVALAMQRWGLHRRIALLALRGVGTRPRQVVLGFMLVTALLSMWVSNTATAVMMLPIALSVIGLLEGEEEADGGDGTSNIGVCLLLGIAYAASIGGIGTLIGTPPNLFLASYIKDEFGHEVSFVRWMGVGLPLVAVFLPATWWLLTRAIHPLADGDMDERRRDAIDGALAREQAGLGALSRGEATTLAVFSAMALLWVLRPLLSPLQIAGATPFAGLTDAGIAVLAALALFSIPVDARRGVFAIDWETARELPWGVLLLFGGGLSLAAAIRANGVGELLGHQVSALGGIPSPLLVVGVVALMIFLTELTSNTATTAALVPILAGLAPGLGVSPYLLIVPAAIAASCAFMLPVATPPNAVVFGSGRVTVPQMARAGLGLNLLGVVLITALTYAVAMPLLAPG